jgi:hypothetical protein
MKSLFAAAALTVVLAAGCGEDDSRDRDQPPQQSGSAHPVQRRVTSSTDDTARIGEPIESRVVYEQDGRTRRLRMSVRPARVVDPARNRQTPAGSGRRWLRIDVSVRNLGPTPVFLDAMPISLVDRRGRTFGRVVSDAPWRQLLGRVLPGESERGSLGFLVDDEASMRELRLSPFTGAPRTATWTFGR